MDRMTIKLCNLSSGEFAYVTESSRSSSVGVPTHVRVTIAVSLPRCDATRIRFPRQRFDI